MTGIPGVLGNLIDLAIVIFGFGLIIFVHELGHFIAARWAGIRVLAFAIGFGPALVSYRKGLGLRRGSSEEDYRQRVGTHPAGASTDGVEGVSSTEYRLNMLPLGGYVKMLGQDDLDPTAVSAAPDSYQSCPPWRRMIVISAGVAMNIVTAALLFIVVFMVGLQVEPATVGAVAPGSAASKAVPIGAPVDRAGIQPGDEVLAINDRDTRSFSDITLAAAIAKRNEAVGLTVKRAGIEEPLDFEIVPEASPLTGLLDFGILPSQTNRLRSLSSPAQRDQWDELMRRQGLAGVEPGMNLTRVGALTQIDGPVDALHAVRNSDGEPIELEFRNDERSLVVEIAPTPELQSDLLARPDGSRAVVEHILGLSPVMTVSEFDDDPKQGLQAGDIFAVLGSVEFPTPAQGIAEIRAHAGRTISVVVLRASPDGTLVRKELSPKVGRRDSRIGFLAGDTAATRSMVGTPPPSLLVLEGELESSREPAAHELIKHPGTVIARVDGAPVASLADVRNELLRSTRDAFSAGAAKASVEIVLELPLPPQADGSPQSTTIDWELTRDDLDRLHALGWQLPFSTALFEYDRTLLKADGPFDAVKLGLAETHRVMLTTYITFARLFGGTVRVEHLKGPVGIAHMGTLLADRGLMWLLFFMALISVNLAVINFLPLPIVDGGQFLMLLYEQMRGRPVPIPVQNVVTMAGLLLIGSIFLIVTFNDVRNLLGL